MNNHIQNLKADENGNNFSLKHSFTTLTFVKTMSVVFPLQNYFTFRYKYIKLCPIYGFIIYL